MTDEEKGPIPEERRREYDSDEAASAKLWAVYISEAEKYDGALVESWKSDMEGLLIFAALFSAILTAFIIESYKSLNPDSGDVTVELLGQISQQLSAAANGSTFHIPPRSHFTPPASSVVCNAFWFISLGLSLACALIATLVQQWARDFLHKTKIQSGPVIRARTLSYFYYGLKRFGMHRTVEIIPLLLHASLVLFFTGLVAFLIPVNAVLTIISSLILLIVGGVYLTLTLLPLGWLDCPYHTPLSVTSWKILNSLRRAWITRRHRLHLVKLPSPDETMMKAMLHAAGDHSTERAEQDYKALAWTMKSLSDDPELEPFVDAIADVLSGPKGRRLTYHKHFEHLILHPDLHLLDRIATLLDSCDAGVLSSDDSRRRRITCYKAFWALASLAKLDGISKELTEALDFGQILSRPSFQSKDFGHYYVSAQAMMAHSTLIAIQPQLQSLVDKLPNRELTHSEYKNFESSWWLIRRRLPETYSIAPPKKFIRAEIEHLLASTPHLIYLNFVSEAALLESPPYQWQETRSAIAVSTVPGVPFDLVFALHEAVSIQLAQLNDDADKTRLEWFDKIMILLLSWWQPNPKNSRIPRAVIHFFLHRYSESSLHPDIYFRLWSCFPKTLSRGALYQPYPLRPLPPVSLYQPYPLRPLPPVSTEDVLTAMWRVASFPSSNDLPAILFRDRSLDQSILESALEVLSNAVFSSTESEISHSLLAMLKIQVLSKIPTQSSTVREVLSIRHPLFPLETIVHIPDYFTQNVEREWNTMPEYIMCDKFLNEKISEAKFCVVTGYLEYCASNIHALPYKAHTTLNKIFDHDSIEGRPRRIHPTHQIRFAESIHRIFEAGQPLKLVGAIIDCKWWSIYGEGKKTEEEMREHLGDPRGSKPWLQDFSARQIVRAAFAQYEENAGRSGDFRVRNILEGLDSWHPEDAVGDPSPIANADDTVAEERRTVAENLEGSAVDSDPSSSRSSEVNETHGVDGGT
ncbi:hypothetical protein C8R46DRAFT_546485 [Mycena filopes]|nr:hypothetical protein C8R46DRAFT_546485 [Mycena filopes]